MPRSTNDTNESRKRFAHLALIFTTVIAKYRDLCSLHPLVASQIDHDVPANRRFDFNACDYKIDITRACEAAVKGQANEDELKDAIDRLIAGDQSVPETLTRQVIRLVGAKFISHQLEPARYLRRIKRGRGERVRVSA